MKKLQIPGTGCPKCKKLAENTEAAAKAAGIEYEIEKVSHNVARHAPVPTRLIPALR